MQEFIHGAYVFVLYLVPMAAAALTARKLVKIPDELFRKILHFILLGAYFVFLFSYDTWWISVAMAAILIVIFYPILALAVRLPFFSSFVNERKEGEFKSSMILALLTVIFSVSVCWGLLGDKLLTLACVYAWGIGDGFAALVGRRYGKHKVNLPFVDPRKSWEGSGTMFFFAFASVLTVLLIRGGLGTGACLFISVVAAAATTYAELCSRNGLDTIICPAVAMSVILPLVSVLGG